jgi:hypothetical protein
LDTVADVASTTSGAVYVLGSTFGALPGQTNASDQRDVFLIKIGE